jgi:glycosyltransferase involved in cell wall biosynthesis
MIDRRRKILIVIPSLAIGGAERVTVDLMRSMDRSRFEMTIVLLTKAGEFLEQVPSDVRIVDLKRRNRFSSPRLVLRLALLLLQSRPDTILGVMTTANVFVVLAAMLTGFSGRIVLNEQLANFSAFRKSGETYGRIAGPLIRLLYRFANAVIVASQGVGRELVRHYGVPANKTCVIHNPVDSGRILALSKEFPVSSKGGKPLIVSCGRLVKQKNYAMLVQAFHEVRRHEPCQLLLIGDGPERNSLEVLSRQLGVHEDVCFAGAQRNPYPMIARGNVFVLSSEYEGFGVAIVEAMSLGKPVIATRCPAGPEEILAPSGCGILVDVGDVGAMAAAIIRVLRNDNLRDLLSSKGRSRAADFELAPICRRYEGWL